MEEGTSAPLEVREAEGTQEKGSLVTCYYYFMPRYSFSVFILYNVVTKVHQKGPRDLMFWLQCFISGKQTK